MLRAPTAAVDDVLPSVASVRVLSRSEATLFSTWRCRPATLVNGPCLALAQLRCRCKACVV